MLRKEQNDFLTQTGPGTQMGQLFRSYWLPVLLAQELPENECPPVRVKALSERLLAFRDTEGRYGLIDEFCAHRASRSGSAATRNPGCAAPTMAGNTTSPASASTSPRNPAKAVSARRSSSNPIRW